MTFELKVDHKDIAQAIGDLRKKIENPKDLLRDIGQVIEEDIKNRIVTTKLDINDKPYAPWAKSTEKARQHDGSAALGILHHTGTLVRSITSKVTGKSTLNVGTNLGYASFLNDGTNKMPARQFIGISKRAQSGIDEAIKLYLGDKK